MSTPSATGVLLLAHGSRGGADAALYELLGRVVAEGAVAFGAALTRPFTGGRDSRPLSEAIASASAAGCTRVVIVPLLFAIAPGLRALLDHAAREARIVVEIAPPIGQTAEGQQAIAAALLDRATAAAGSLGDRDGLVIAGQGTPRYPQALAPVLAKLGRGMAGYLEAEAPSPGAATFVLRARGCTQIVVAPAFFVDSPQIRVDLPRAVLAAAGDTPVIFAPPLGDHPALATAIGALAAPARWLRETA